jgi:C-terminal processing protease CtpA/Prc
MHHALHYWTLAAEQQDSGAKKCLRDVADMIRANPDAGYWELFQRVYPEDVAKFRYHCGGQLDVKGTEGDDGPPNGGWVFGAFVINHNGPGVLVSKVIPNSPAKGAGLEVGDAIVRIDGQAVATADDFVRAIGAAGATVKIVVRNVRDGSHFEADVHLNK